MSRVPNYNILDYHLLPVGNLPRIYSPSSHYSQRNINIINPNQEPDHQEPFNPDILDPDKQKECLTANPTLVYYIPGIDLELELQLIVVHNNGCNITYIPNPCSETQHYALYQAGVFALRYIKNPCREVQAKAIKQNIYTLPYIKDISVLPEDLDYTISDSNGFNLLWTLIPEHITFLLNHGADPYKTSVTGDSPYDSIEDVSIIVDKRTACKRIILFLRKCKFYRFIRLLNSKKFCEWYYAPENRGGKKSKMQIEKALK
jgi:hypothetical protein